MNRANFERMMNSFAKVYERVLAPDVLKIYFSVCSEVPDSQVNTVIRNCLKKCQFFPRPADIFKSFDETAMESHKVETIQLTDKQREDNLQRIKRLKEDLNKQGRFKYC